VIPVPREIFNGLFISSPFMNRIDDDWFVRLHVLSQEVVEFYFENIDLENAACMEDICNRTRFQNSSFWKIERKVR